jgi:hypothetical protein
MLAANLFYPKTVIKGWPQYRQLMVASGLFACVNISGAAIRATRRTALF